MYTPILSEKSSRQQRNVFIWCGKMEEIAMGLHVDTVSPHTISTVHRWITTIVQTETNFKPRTFSLFPVVIQPAGVLRYHLQQCGPALAQESQEGIAPGHYGIYNQDGSRPSRDYIFTSIISYAGHTFSNEKYSVALAKKASLPTSIAEKALARDKGCVFTGVSPPTSENLVATWIFPPFLGHTQSDDPWLHNVYHKNPDACGLEEFMVVTNTLSGCRDVIALFYENMLGIDVDDNYRIIVFEGSEGIREACKSHVTFVDSQDRPSDRYLRLHFQRCLFVSVLGGDPTGDYEEQEIELTMEELYDEMDFSDSRWGTPLGLEIRADLIRKDIALRDELILKYPLSQFSSTSLER